MYSIEPIAKIYNGYHEKFGVPRQSGLVPSAISYIVLEEKYRIDEALRGIEEYSHIWVLWRFSEFESEKFSPTVRPPRLGGNTRVGVFATRSPNRPNSIGMSSLALIKVIKTQQYGTVLAVSGADMISGTPILDIKPYVPYTDSHPDAKGSFADKYADYSLSVSIPSHFLEKIDPSDRETIYDIIKNDPRPSYQNSPDRAYTFDYSKYSVSFKVSEECAEVCSITVREVREDIKL